MGWYERLTSLCRVISIPEDNIVAEKAWELRACLIFAARMCALVTMSRVYEFDSALEKQPGPSEKRYTHLLFETRVIFRENVKSLGVCIGSFRVLGGGARSPLSVMKHVPCQESR